MSEGRSGEKEKARGFFSQSMETAKGGEDEEAEAGRGDAAQERGANVCVRDKGRSIYLPCRPSSSNQKQRTLFCDEVLALPSRVERASKRERERERESPLTTPQASCMI